MTDNHSDRHHRVQDAIAALDSGQCVWCEHKRAAMTSYLCDECRRQDPDGLLRKPVALRLLEDAEVVAA
jgi:hypothetical protein